MPSVAEVWADCEGSEEGCDLAARVPGFWVHVLVNVAWALLAVVAVLAVSGAALDARETRAARFDDEHARQRWSTARATLRLVAALAFALAALPGRPVNVDRLEARPARGRVAVAAGLVLCGLGGVAVAAWLDGGEETRWMRCCCRRRRWSGATTASSTV